MARQRSTGLAVREEKIKMDRIKMDRMQQVTPRQVTPRVRLPCIHVLAAWALLSAGAVEAAAIGLSTDYPDVAFDGPITYTAPICNKSAGSGGAATAICGSVISGRTYNGSLVTAGKLTVTDSNLYDLVSPAGLESDVMFYTGGGNINAGFYGDFTLTAYFNADGVFGSTVTDTALRTSTLSLVLNNVGATNFSGAPFTIIASNLGSIGFSGTAGAGIFEFATGGAWGGSITGGLWDGGNEFSGTILGTTITSGVPSGNWDTTIATSGDLAIFKQNWSGATNVNTFVPVPAAAWLFATGLTLLAGLAKRRRA